jgi:hypothetical protein
MQSKFIRYNFKHDMFPQLINPYHSPSTGEMRIVVHILVFLLDGACCFDCSTELFALFVELEFITFSVNYSKTFFMCL